MLAALGTAVGGAITTEKAAVDGLIAQYLTTLPGGADQAEIKKQLEAKRDTAEQKAILASTATYVTGFDTHTDAGIGGGKNGKQLLADLRTAVTANIPTERRNIDDLITQYIATLPSAARAAVEAQLKATAQTAEAVNMAQRKLCSDVDTWSSKPVPAVVTVVKEFLAAPNDTVKANKFSSARDAIVAAVLAEQKIVATDPVHDTVKAALETQINRAPDVLKDAHNKLWGPASNWTISLPQPPEIQAFLTEANTFNINALASAKLTIFRALLTEQQITPADPLYNMVKLYVTGVIDARVKKFTAINQFVETFNTKNHHKNILGLGGILGSALINNLETAITTKEYVDAEQKLQSAIELFCLNNKAALEQNGVYDQVYSKLMEVKRESAQKSPAAKISGVIRDCIADATTNTILEEFLTGEKTRFDVQTQINQYVSTNCDPLIKSKWLVPTDPVRQAYENNIKLILDTYEKRQKGIQNFVENCIKCPDAQDEINKFIDGRMATALDLRGAIDRYIASSEGKAKALAHGLNLGGTSQDEKCFRKALDTSIDYQDKIAQIVIRCLNDAQTEIDAFKRNTKPISDVQAKIKAYLNGDGVGVASGIGLNINTSGKDKTVVEQAVIVALARIEQKALEDLLKGAVDELTKKCNGMSQLTSTAPITSNNDLETYRKEAMNYIASMLEKPNCKPITSPSPDLIALRAAIQHDATLEGKIQERLESEVATAAAQKAWENSKKYKEFVTACKGKGDGKFKDLIDKKRAAITHLENEILKKNPFIGKASNNPIYQGADKKRLIKFADDYAEKSDVYANTIEALSQLCDRSPMQAFIRSLDLNLLGSDQTIKDAITAAKAELKALITTGASAATFNNVADRTYLKTYIDNIAKLYDELLKSKEVQAIKNFSGDLSEIGSLEQAAKARLQQLIRDSALIKDYPEVIKERYSKQLESSIDTLIINTTVRNSIVKLLENNNDEQVVAQISAEKSICEKELRQKYADASYDASIREALKQFDDKADTVKKLISKANKFIELCEKIIQSGASLTLPEDQEKYDELRGILNDDDDGYNPLFASVKSDPDLTDFLDRYLKNKMGDDYLNALKNSVGQDKKDDSDNESVGEGEADDDDAENEDGGKFEITGGKPASGLDTTFTDEITTVGKYLATAAEIKHQGTKGKFIVDYSDAGTPKFKSAEVKKLLTSTLKKKDGTGDHKDLSSAVTLPTATNPEIIKFKGGQSDDEKKDRIQAAVLILQGVAISNKGNGQNAEINAKDFRDEDLVKILHKFNKALFRAHSSGDTIVKDFTSVRINYVKNPENPGVKALVDAHNEIHDNLQKNPNQQPLNPELMRDFQDKLKATKVVKEDHITRKMDPDETEYKAWLEEKKYPETKYKP